MLFPCVKQFALTESLSTQEYKGGSSKLSGTPDEILVGGGGGEGGKLRLDELLASSTD